MHPLLLIIVLVALIWAAVFVLRGSPVAGCLVFVVVGACFGFHFVHFDLGPLPLTLDRLVLALVVLAYLVQARCGQTDPKPLARADWCLLALLGLMAASAVVYAWDSPPKDRIAAFFRLATGYVFPFVVYWIARQSPLSPSKISRVYGVLAVLGIYLALTGLMEVAGQWWAVFPRHIADPKAGIHFGRARGPMVHAVSFGVHVGVCLLAAWAWRQRFGRLGRLALLAVSPVMLAAVYFSYTRSVWMGTGLALVVILGFSLQGRWRILALGGIAAAALLMAATRMEKMISFQRDVGATASDTRKSVDLRGSFAYLSWKMFLDRPLLGAGFDQFTKAKLPYLSDRSGGVDLEVTRPYVHHNTILSILTELGLVGLVLYAAVIITWARAAWDLVRSRDGPDWVRTQGVFFLGVLAIYVCQAAFHELSYMSIDSVLVFFLAGLTVGLRATVVPCGGVAPRPGWEMFFRAPAPGRA